MVRDKLLQTGAEPLSHLLHMLGKVRLKDHVKHCVARRHRERIAAIGRTMRAEHHAFCGLFTGKAGPERETAANAFCDRHDVGDNAILLIGEEAARTHDPALHFIQYEEHVLRSEEHTSELQSLMRISYAVFCLKKKKK